MVRKLGYCRAGSSFNEVCGLRFWLEQLILLGCSLGVAVPRIGAAGIGGGRAGFFSVMMVVVISIESKDPHGRLTIGCCSTLSSMFIKVSRNL